MQNNNKKDLKNKCNPIVPVPLFQLIRDRILLELYQKSYSAGSILGTEEDLCRKYQVSRKTIRHAVGELEIAGYLKRRQKVGIIVTDKTLQVHSAQKKGRRIIILLPQWSYTTGNQVERIIAHDLGMPETFLEAFDVELRPFHAPLPENSKNLYAVIAVDPLPQHLPTLEKFAENGIRIIAVEPRINFYMAVNVHPDIPAAAHDAVAYLYRQGHRRIGLVWHYCNHYTFQQWLNSFIQAMTEHELPILPYSILENADIPEADDLCFRKITAWICLTLSNLDALQDHLKKMKLSVPRDVSIICADDPIDGDGQTQNIPVSIYTPNTKELVLVLRRLLESAPVSFHPGSVLFYPMTHVYRQSVAKCRQ